VDQWNLAQTYPSTAGEVRWDRFGPAKGRPVVLLHGTPFSSFVWRAVAAELSRQRPVFVWDMPGYGSSEMSAGQDVSIAAQGRVFAELTAVWRLDEPDVVAHDIGGAVSLRGTLLHGLRFRRLVLVDPVALRPWGSPFFRLVHDHATAFEQLPAHLHRALVRAYIADASSGGLTEDVLHLLVQPWLGEAGQAAFYRQIAQADQRYTDEIQDRYGSIDLPVLVCWGADDAWIPWQQGKELADAIPNARFELIPGAGHLVQEDAPAALTDLIVDFLGSRGRTSPGGEC
jgi:pimeloyl-ACP methyl ester carboxylesterase